MFKRFLSAVCSKTQFLRIFKHLALFDRNLRVVRSQKSLKRILSDRLPSSFNWYQIETQERMQITAAPPVTIFSPQF